MYNLFVQLYQTSLSKLHVVVNVYNILIIFCLAKKGLINLLEVHLGNSIILAPLRMGIGWGS